MKRKFKTSILSFLLVISCSFVALAQNKDVPVPGTNDSPPPPVGLPIDLGLTYLFGLGIAYGVFELKRKK
jgi:hypothetical protein